MHVIKWTDHFSDKFLGDLQVDARARDVGMAHELLYDSKVDALFEQMRSERMTEAIAVCILADLRLDLETAKRHAQRINLHMHFWIVTMKKKSC